MPNVILASVRNVPVVSRTDTTVTGRVKNKFQQGWLGGCGSDSQFQSLNNLPILPYSSNDDMLQRIASSTGAGSVAGVPLLPSWNRSYAFAPGLGVDALRSQITFTSKGAGLGVETGVVAPLISAGIDRTDVGPVPVSVVGVDTLQMQAPKAETGGEGAAMADAVVKSDILRAAKLARRGPSQRQSRVNVFK